METWLSDAGLAVQGTGRPGLSRFWRGLWLLRFLWSLRFGVAGDAGNRRSLHFASVGMTTLDGEERWYPTLRDKAAKDGAPGYRMGAAEDRG